MKNTDIHIIYLFLTRISIVLRFFQGLKSLHVDFTGTGDFCYHLFIPKPIRIGLINQMDNLSSEEHKRTYLAELLFSIQMFNTKKEMYH